MAELRYSRRYLLSSLVAGVATPGCLGSKTMADYSGHWPNQGFDKRNTGYNPEATGPGNSVEIRWTFTKEVYTSPAVADGRIYFGDVNGTVHALGLNRGHKEWSVETAGSVYSAPAVANGTVYIASSGGYLFALDSETGDKKWKQKPTEFSFSSPTVVDGTVYIGGWDGDVCSLDAETGKLKWLFESQSNVSYAPAVADGFVYVLSDRLYALDAETGEKQWAFETDGLIKSDPAITNKTLYVGDRGANLYALVPENGNEQWRLSVGEGPESAIDTGVVAAGKSLYTASGKVIAVGPS